MILGLICSINLVRDIAPLRRVEQRTHWRKLHSHFSFPLMNRSGSLCDRYVESKHQNSAAPTETHVVVPEIHPNIIIMQSASTFMCSHSWGGQTQQWGWYCSSKDDCVGWILGGGRFIWLMCECPPILSVRFIIYIYLQLVVAEQQVGYPCSVGYYLFVYGIKTLLPPHPKSEDRKSLFGCWPTHLARGGAGIISCQPLRTRIHHDFKQNWPP